MGKYKRIAEQDIREMKKTLDALPDKNLGKTREEAADLLNANILKALEKGYTVRELAEIMAKGNVSIPAPLIRAKVFPPRDKPQKAPVSKAAKKEKPKPTMSKPESHVPSKKQPETPAYYTPDKEVL